LLWREFCAEFDNSGRPALLWMLCRLPGEEQIGFARQFRGLRGAGRERQSGRQSQQGDGVCAGPEAMAQPRAGRVVCCVLCVVETHDEITPSYLRSSIAWQPSREG